MEFDALPSLNLIDIIALAIIGIGGIQGFCRGLSGELARLIGTVLAFVAGVSLHGPVGEWIQTYTRLDEQPAHAVAFITTVVLAVLIMIVLRLVLKRLMKIVFAEGFDKSIGILAGLLRMTVTVCIIFLIMNLVPHPYLNRHFGEESMFGSIVVRYVPTIRETLERANIPTRQSPPSNPGEDREAI
jgi:uncharacterized membrane protein required for colicin V production